MKAYSVIEQCLQVMLRLDRASLKLALIKYYENYYYVRWGNGAQN